MTSIPLRWGIVTSFATIVAVSSYFNFQWIVNELRPTYLTVVEDSLNDTARLLSALLSSNKENESIIEPSSDLGKTFDQLKHTAFNAEIYDLTKAEVDLFVYVTDNKGSVVFHSKDPEEEAKDYSNWRDVNRTLRGEYGARTTRNDPEDAKTSILYVAAPIFDKHHNISGVVTVGKPISWAVLVIDKVREHVFFGGVIASLISFLLALLISSWIIRPVERFTHYAREVAKGNHRAKFPRLGEVTEMRVLGEAYEDMRIALDGKKYVENYVEQLTHELKSPVSAIKGASELLSEEMPEDDRKRFIHNIQIETGRMTRIIDHLFKLSELESARDINKEPFDIIPLIQSLLTDLGPQLEAKTISLSHHLSDRVILNGDKDLIGLAIANLLENAIDFSPDETTMDLSCSIQNKAVIITVKDEGPGIPEYAKNRIFDKFYSLGRPESGMKSTGLGLTFVHQIAELHNGSIVLTNRDQGGTHATLTFPLDLQKS